MKEEQCTCKCFAKDKSEAKRKLIQMGYRLEGGIFNYDKFHERATEIILSALYEYSNPVDLFNTTAAEINTRKEKAILSYRGDPMTHARVRNIVAMLSNSIDGCIEEA